MLLITHNPQSRTHREPWNKGKLVGPKPPFKLQEIWAIRIRLEIGHRGRELAVFNLAVDSKLRGCDLVRLKVSDVMHVGQVVSRAMVVQHKTQQPVRFELTEQTRVAVAAWIRHAGLAPAGYLFPGGWQRHPICLLVNMRDTSSSGPKRSVETPRGTEHIRCVAPKRPSAVAASLAFCDVHDFSCTELHAVLLVSVVKPSS